MLINRKFDELGALEMNLVRRSHIVPLFCRHNLATNDHGFGTDLASKQSGYHLKQAKNRTGRIRKIIESDLRHNLICVKTSNFRD